MSELACPVCGTDLELGHLFVDADHRAAVTRLIETALPLGALLLQYTRLFAPPKTRLTTRKQVRIILQLLPDLERRAIDRAGRQWPVPLTLWAQGMEQMLAARDAGRLELPMKGHGYLYTILAGLADKAAASAEAQQEAARRSGAHRGAAVQVHAGAQPLGQVLAAAMAAQPDPALADIERRNRTAAPMPAAVRQQIAALRQKPSPSL
jgi:hypothetical protein